MQRRAQDLVAPLLAHREGVVHRAEVARRLDDRLVDREVAAGRWVRPAPAVAVAAAVPDERQLCVAALVHARPHGVLTGRAACRLHRVRDVPAGGPVEVLVPHAVRRVSTRYVRVLRAVEPVPAQVLLGLPVVGAARAVADAARGTAALRDVRALVLAAVADGIVGRTALEEQLQLGPRHGSAHLRRALDDAARGLASAPEAEVADLLVPWARRRRLQVVFNPVLVRDGVLVCSPDAYLPALGLGVETESVRHHGSGRDLAATLRRHERVEAAGVRLLHETPWSARTEPQAVLDRVTAAAAQAPGPPAGLLVLPFDDPRARRWRR